MTDVDQQWGLNAPNASGAAFSWGTTRMTLAGGTYRLCWCPGNHFRCSEAVDFTTDIGAVPAKETKQSSCGRQHRRVLARSANA